MRRMLALMSQCKLDSGVREQCLKNGATARREHEVLPWLVPKRSFTIMFRAVARELINTSARMARQKSALPPIPAESLQSSERRDVP